MGTTFHLESVLRIRRAQEESARHHLLVCNRHLHDQLGINAADHGRYRRIPRTLGPLSRQTFRREVADGDLAAAALVSSQAAVASARSEVEVAHLTWSQAARRVEALDRLRRRRLEEDRASDERRQLMLVDDLITSRWVSPLIPLAGTPEDQYADYQ